MNTAYCQLISIFNYVCIFHSGASAVSAENFFVMVDNVSTTSLKKVNNLRVHFDDPFNLKPHVNQVLQKTCCALILVEVFLDFGTKEVVTGLFCVTTF